MKHNRTVLFIGDSLTEWFDLQRYFPDLRMHNEGIAGDTTFGVLERIEDIRVQDYAQIFLMIGINDIFNGFSQEDIIENLEIIIENLQTYASQSKLVVQSILPVNETMLGSPNSLNKSIKYINRCIKKHCESRGVDYLDLYPFFLSGQEMKRVLTTDGGHLSDEGYRLWTEKIKAFLD